MNKLCMYLILFLLACAALIAIWPGGEALVSLVAALVVAFTVGLAAGSAGWLSSSTQAGVRTLGTALSSSGKADLDRIYNESGFQAIKVGGEPLNGDLSTDAEDKQEIVELIYRYADHGFIFMTPRGGLFGHLTAIETPEDRVSRRRNAFRVVASKTESPEPN